MKDIAREDHNIAFFHTKSILKGGLLGGIFGYMAFIGGPSTPLEMDKLMAATGARAYSGRGWRMLKNVTFRPAMMGAAAMTAYNGIQWFMRHHDEGNPRPYFYDHLIATTAIGFVGGCLYASHPFSVFTATFFSASVLAPASWWAFKSGGGLNRGNVHANIFYENNVTKEEVERFRMQDEVESIGLEMFTTPGYGAHMQSDPRGI